jgi:hypothetical protein
MPVAADPPTFGSLILSVAGLLRRGLLNVSFFILFRIYLEQRRSGCKNRKKKIYQSIFANYFLANVQNPENRGQNRRFVV